MPLPRAVLVTLTAADRTTLKKRAGGAKTAHRDRLRAQIVLAAARGRDNARIAADLQITADTVRKWRGRFAARGLAGLADLSRCGRPRRISELTRAAVVALACQLPAATGVPLSRWTGPELLAEITRAGAAEEKLSVVLGAADLGRAPGQALAVPVLDLPPRPGLRRQGDRDPGPLPGVLPRHAATARRPDPVSGRQAVHPGPRPLPSHRPGRARQTRPGRARIRPPRRLGPAGRPGRAHWESVRRHSGHHRHRPVYGPDGPGHEPAGVQGRAPGVRHRGQWLRPPWPGRRLASATRTRTRS